MKMKIVQHSVLSSLKGNASTRMVLSNLPGIQCGLDAVILCAIAGTTYSVCHYFSKQKNQDELAPSFAHNTLTTELHFQNKMVALASDPHSLESENISLQPLSKRMRTQRTGTNAEHCTDYSIRPNYVEYEGQYFHMAEFLSLQEGKVYRTGMS